MKNFLFIICSFITLTSRAQTITIQQAKDSIDRKATVCDVVKEVYVSQNGTTLINFGASYPNQVFSAVIFFQNESLLSYPPQTLKGKTICVTGIVKDYKGKPQIEILDEKQIEIKGDTK